MLATGPVALPLGAAGPFDRPLWFDRLAAMHWSNAPRRDGHGKAAGCSAWMPLVEAAPGHFASLTNWYSFAYRPQFTGGRNAGAQAMALTDLCASLRSSAARLTFRVVPETDGSSAALRDALRTSGWWVVAHKDSDSHWLDLAGADFDTWWQSRPGAVRNTVARKAKKNIVTIYIATRCDPDIWAAYEKIYAASWKPNEGNPALLRAFAEDEGRAGRIRLGVAHIDGEPVAAQFWTVENGCAYIHKLAHVEDSVRASPGTLLTAAMFRHVIDKDHVRRVDFGTGDDPYKRDWMNRHNRLWCIEAYNPSRLRAWPAAAKAMLSVLRHGEQQ